MVLAPMSPWAVTVAENGGWTVICSAANVGETGSVGGITYTKRSKTQIDALVDGGDYASLTTTCTSDITDMSSMFHSAHTFNGDINSWDVSTVTSVDSMFYNAHDFNQDIDSWDVSSVTDMSSMFYNAHDFNQDIDSWDVSSVTDMSSMFYQVHDFNGDIDSWDVSSVTDMSSMFYQVHDFNQDLSGWCVSNITSKPSDFDYGTYSWVLPHPVWGTCPSSSSASR
jgi:surface protein